MTTNTPHLPLEILSHIAGYLAGQNEPLSSHTVVSRSWQTAFEAEIYRSLVIISPTSTTQILVGSAKNPYPKKGLTIEVLDKLTKDDESGQSARRAAIRSLIYRVGVPHWLDDGTHEKAEEGYKYDNKIRRENNAAFTAGIQALFHYLSSWTKQSQSISLGIALQAEHIYSSDEIIEPNTYPLEGIWEPLAPYRASFTTENRLEEVSCISSVYFPQIPIPEVPGDENGLTPAAALHIALACSRKLREIDLNFDDIIPSSEAQLQLAKRNATARGLEKLSFDLEKLSINWGWDDAYPDGEKEYMYPLPPPKGKFCDHPDILTAALRTASRRVREFQVERLQVSPDFFYPIEETEMAKSAWSRLEVLTLTSIPFTTTAGGHLRYCHGLSEQPREIVSRDGRPAYFSNIHPFFALYKEFFDTLYRNAGFAAREMPRLKQLKITHGLGHPLVNEQDQELQLVMTELDRGTLSFESLYGYSPCQDVLNAWNVHEEPILWDGRLNFKVERWPSTK